MIDKIDAALAKWVTGVIGKVDTRFDMPAEKPEKNTVVLYLFSFAPTPPASTGHRSPVQFSLRYLVTTWGKSVSEAHKLLGSLAIAAIESDDYEVELEPVAPEIWTGFGLPPQPGFVLRALLVKPRPEPEPKYVTKVVLDPRPSVSFFGVLRGPQDLPIARARIELKDAQRATYSDASGRFHFDNLPAGMPLKIRIKAKGRVFDVTSEEPTSMEEPLVIPFTLP